MHPDEAALLRAVCATPDDDLPRLVFADWLDEHGEPVRAEFIRAQIELAKLADDSPRRRQLAFRCRELIDTEGLSLSDPPVVPQFGRFRRGFFEVSEIEGADLGPDTTSEFAVTPIRRLWVCGQFGIEQLSAIPNDNRLLSLDLNGSPFDATDLFRLSQMKQFPHLVELGLMCCELQGRHTVQTLCEQPLFQTMTAIRLGGNPFGDADQDILREHFGARVSFTCARDPEYLYAFHHIDSRFTVGFGRDHTQLFLMAGRHRGQIAVFDHTGNLIRFDERPGTDGDPDELERRWLAEYGGEPATIRVMKFQFPGGVGIEDFVPWRIAELESPIHDEEREHNVRWFERWLGTGQFRWRWSGEPGSDWWLNRDGEVTDT